MRNVLAISAAARGDEKEKRCVGVFLNAEVMKAIKRGQEEMFCALIYRSQSNLDSGRKSFTAFT